MMNLVGVAKANELEHLRRVKQRAVELVGTYTFKMRNVLDANRRTVPEENRVQLWQLFRELDGTL